jgi:hypothetical protein
VSEVRRVAAPVITDDTPIGPDIDLDDEVILLPSGTRLTNEVAEELAREIIEKTRAEFQERTDALTDRVTVLEAILWALGMPLDSSAPITGWAAERLGESRLRVVQ